MRPGRRRPLSLASSAPSRRRDQCRPALHRPTNIVGDRLDQRRSQVGARRSIQSAQCPFMRKPVSRSSHRLVRRRPRRTDTSAGRRWAILRPSPSAARVASWPLRPRPLRAGRPPTREQSGEKAEVGILRRPGASARASVRRPRQQCRARPARHSGAPRLPRGSPHRPPPRSASSVASGARRASAASSAASAAVRTSAAAVGRRRSSRAARARALADVPEFRTTARAPTGFGHLGGPRREPRQQPQVRLPETPRPRLPAIARIEKISRSMPLLVGAILVDSAGEHLFCMAGALPGPAYQSTSGSACASSTARRPRVAVQSGEDNGRTSVISVCSSDPINREEMKERIFEEDSRSRGRRRPPARQPARRGDPPRPGCCVEAQPVGRKLRDDRPVFCSSHAAPVHFRDGSAAGHASSGSLRRKSRAPGRPRDVPRRCRGSARRRRPCRPDRRRSGKFRRDSEDRAE